MSLLFKLLFFSWLDSYDIYSESGTVVYTIQGKLAWGHKLLVSDSAGNELGTIREEPLTFLPRFSIYLGNRKVGQIKKDFTFFRPSFHLDCMGWQVNGNFMEWDYTITDRHGMLIATISKELFHWTDTYILEIDSPENALYVLMVALAIDAAKCSQGA